MKKIFNSLVLAAVVSSAGFVANVSAEGKLDDLLKQVKQDRISEGALNKKREQEFNALKADK